MPTVTLRIKVKPNARASSLEQEAGGTWLARLKSPPVDGKANEELIGLVAERFGCRKADVAIRSGASGRMKLVVVESAQASSTGGPGHASAGWRSSKAD
jgi:hypothetical protein